MGKLSSAGQTGDTEDNPLAATSTLGNFNPVLYVGSDGKLNGQFYFIGANPSPIVSSAAVTDGNWHHVVFSSAPATQTLWLDGTQVGTLKGWSAAGDTLTSPWLLAHAYLGSGYLGWQYPDQPHPGSSTVYATYFQGSIADAAFFTRPATAGAVAGMSSAAANPATLLNKVTRPSGKIYAQVAYDAASNTITQVTDENGGSWTLAAPVVTGSSQVYRSAVLGAHPADYYRFGDAVGAATAANEVHGGTATYNSVTLGVAGPFADATATAFNRVASHPLTEDQLYGGETVEHSGVTNLSSEQLMMPGGPNGDDPISGYREWAPDDTVRYPGSEVHITAGHHRTFLIAQRVLSGEIDPEALVEFAIRR